MFDKPFNAAPDLTDPAVLAQEAESMAGGMRQQANMAQTGTAMGGHPNPAYLYNKTADILTACAAMIKGSAAAVPEAPPVPQSWGDGAEAPTPPVKKRGRPVKMPPAANPTDAPPAGPPPEYEAAEA